jgi:hypothetical protein
MLTIQLVMTICIGHGPGSRRGRPQRSAEQRLASPPTAKEGECLFINRGSTHGTNQHKLNAGWPSLTYWEMVSGIGGECTRPRFRRHAAVLLVFVALRLSFTPVIALPPLLHTPCVRERSCTCWDGGVRPYTRSVGKDWAISLNWAPKKPEIIIKDTK